MAALLYPEVAKNIASTPKERHYIKWLQKCLYAFTKEALFFLFKDWKFRMVYSYFMTMKKEELLMKHKSLTKHADDYQRAFDYLDRLFNEIDAIDDQ